MRINICPKENTPYFAMGSKCESRHKEFAHWLQQHGVQMNYERTDIVKFEKDEDVTIFFLTWPHSYAIVE